MVKYKIKCTYQDFDEIRIYNLMGLKVFETTEMSDNYDVSYLPSGIYQMMVVYRENTYYYKLKLNQ